MESTAESARWNSSRLASAAAPDPRGGADVRTVADLELGEEGYTVPAALVDDGTGQLAVSGGFPVVAVARPPALLRLLRRPHGVAVDLGAVPRLPAPLRQAGPAARLLPVVCVARRL